MKTVNMKPSLKETASNILSQGFDVNVKPERLSSGLVHGIGYIGLTQNVVVECLLLGTNNGSLELGVSLPDVAKIINTEAELSMVFFPALNASFSEYLISDKFSDVVFPHVDNGVNDSNKVPAIYCKLGGIDYNKGNKTLSAKPTLFSQGHLELFKYLVVQNDNWSAVLNG
tara:strand:- start:1966 stop:2478 length:513 start_codon:yes stop_codon:yes gene_type:complete